MRFFVVSITLFFLACTMQPSTVASETTPTSTTGGSSTGGQGVQLNLWSRGPIQAGSDSTLDSRDNLDASSVRRQAVSLFDLSSKTGSLVGPKLQVFYSESTSDGPGKASPLVSSWSGRMIPWDTKEFKSFMLYAHGSRAMRYMNELYPSLSFNVRGQSLLPLDAYSSIDGSPLNTRYRINSTGKRGTIMFYQREAESSVRFNPVDESDAIYHEFGHTLQHILNPDVLESGGNYDVDMLLEGLADFYAASAVKDDQILQYLGSNAPLVFSANNRTGRQHQRKLGAALRFPNNYVGDFHLDARVVANALNDVRKYLQGQTLTLLQDCGSNCTVSWNTADNVMSLSDAYNAANHLAHEALREIVPLSSIVHYSEKLIAAANSRNWSEECGTQSACKTQVVNAVRSILKSRGIYTSNPIRCDSSGDCNPFSFDGTNPELILNHNGGFYFAPLLASSGKSNTNNVVDRCEAMLLIPNIRLRADVQASSYDTLFEVSETTPSATPKVQVAGFSSLNNIDRLSERAEIFDSGQLEIKLFGFLLPGEVIFDLAGKSGSRFYSSHQSAVLSQGFSTFSANNPPPLGWAVRAPATAGEQGYLEFAYSTRPFEVRYVPEDVYTTRSLRQYLTVGASSSSFCGL